jgi:putative peptidoglycan lipid II flippase
VGALAGGALQLAVQLPLVLRLLVGFRLSVSTRVAGVRQALAAFGPLVLGRGVVQLSGYLDLILASLLAAGAVGALGPGQYLYLLPVSLFGLSVAAAELPELARMDAGTARSTYLARVRGGLAQVAFLALPTAVGYLAFGHLLVGALFRTGRFGGPETWLVTLVLAAYSLGLPAATASRLLQNAFYALGETRVPARIAVARVGASALVAVPLMLWLDRYPVAALAALEASSPLRLGAVGLALGSAAASWIELWRLDRALAGRLAGFALPVARTARMAALAAGAALPAAGLWWLLPPLHPVVEALLVVGLFAVLYLGASPWVGLSEAGRWLGRLRRRA